MGFSPRLRLESPGAGAVAVAHAPGQETGGHSAGLQAGAPGSAEGGAARRLGVAPGKGAPAAPDLAAAATGMALPRPASRPPAGAASRRSPSESRAAPPGGGRLSRRGPRGLASCAGRSRGPSDCDCAETEAAARCRPHARGGGNVFPGAIAVSTRFFLCLKRLLTQYLKIRMCLIRCFTGIYQLISWPLTCV